MAQLCELRLCLDIETVSVVCCNGWQEGTSIKTWANDFKF